MCMHVHWVYVDVMKGGGEGEWYANIEITISYMCDS